MHERGGKKEYPDDLPCFLQTNATSSLYPNVVFGICILSLKWKGFFIIKYISLKKTPSPSLYVLPQGQRLPHISLGPDFLWRKVHCSSKGQSRSSWAWSFQIMSNWVTFHFLGSLHELFLFYKLVPSNRGCWNNWFRFDSPASAYLTACLPALLACPRLHQITESRLF